jgi:signal transduction histidine kinase
MNAVNKSKLVVRNQPFAARKPSPCAPKQRVIKRRFLESPNQDVEPIATAQARSADDRLTEQILSAVDREQRRIAEDLHDGVMQQLIAIRYVATSLHRQLVEKHLRTFERLVAMADAAVRQSQQITRSLYVVEEKPLGLVDALATLASRTCEVFSVQCIFRCPRAVLVHNGAVANNLYRITSELVSNAVRHGRARTIRIHLSAKGKTVQLTVADDGVGMRGTTAARNGIGLSLIKHRLRAMHGNFTIRNKRGTQVICTVPVGVLKGNDS